MGGSLARDAAAQTQVSPLLSCAGIGDLRGFTIRSARLNDPFWILRWRKPTTDILTAIAELQGKRYTFEAVNAVSMKIESRTWLPDTSDDWARINYSDIVIEHCDGQQLDVVFNIFSATVSPTLSTVFEWRSKEKTPNEIAGVSQTHAAWQFAPEAGFDQARRATAGGRAQASWTTSQMPFGVFELKGLGSATSHNLSSSLAGQHDSPVHWLRRANWRLNLQDSSAPAGDVHLDERRLGFQFSGTSKPLNGVVTRFGGTLEGGRLHSGFRASELPTGTVSGSDFTSSKLYAGATARARHQAFEASYALVLGSTGSGFFGDWRKHIGDIRHELWLPFSNHRLFELEQRVTVGRLTTLGSVPASERFFGGAGDVPLLVGDGWSIRTNPSIRSIPTNGLASNDSRVGGDRFFAYNSTTAVTVWGKPVVPRELLDDEEFTKTLNAQLTNARSVLEVAYQSDDRHFRAIKDRLPEIVAKLNHLAAAQDAARAAGGVAGAQFAPCEDALKLSRLAADKGNANKPSQALGWVKELLPDGDDALANVVAACGVNLVARLRAAGVAAGDLESASENLKESAAIIEKEFAAIDTKSAHNKAASDMGYAERALGVITREMTITSISPVFVFDVTRIGSAGAGPDHGNRYAIGGGIRFTLASTVSVTATYAANPRRQPGERPGALVFSLTTRNLFE